MWLVVRPQGQHIFTESHFIANTKPALEHILTQNTSMQAKNTTNEHPIGAMEAEELGNSKAAAALKTTSSRWKICGRQISHPSDLLDVRKSSQWQ